MTRKIFLLVVVFLVPSFVLADGGIFPPPDYYMYETDQRAVIFYEQGIETLVLSVTFRGDAKDFGWVIPTPSRPEVSKSSDELFTTLDELTRVEERYLLPLSFDEAYLEGQRSGNVYVVETKKVEYFDIAVLTADEPTALADWLNENNYQFPTSSAYILDSYVDKGWYFTAIKIDVESISPGLTQQLRQGHMVPLQLKFPTDKIIYPLKISSVMGDFKPSNYYPLEDYLKQLKTEVQKLKGEDIGLLPESIPPELLRIAPYYPQKVGLLIYVFTSANKQTISGFGTQYAGWVKKETIEELAFDDQGDPWLRPAKDKYFLTKLTRWMAYSEMTYDLYLRNASDNNLVNARPLEGATEIWFWIVMAASLMVLMGIGVAFVYLSRK